MCARTVLSTLVAIGLLVSVAARALAAGDEPESGPSPDTSTTTPPTTGGSGTIVTPIGSVETTTVQALPPAEAPPPKPIPEITERTAYMVGKHTLHLGILAFEYGIIQQLSVGTDPPSWVAPGGHQRPAPKPAPEVSRSSIAIRSRSQSRPPATTRASPKTTSAVTCSTFRSRCSCR